MASLSFTQFSSVPRWHSSWTVTPIIKLVQLNYIGLKNTRVFAAVSRRKNTEALAQEVSDEEVGLEKKTRRTSKEGSTRTRKKGIDLTVESVSDSVVDDDVMNDENIATSESSKTPKKTRISGRRKATSTSNSLEEAVDKKVTRCRRTKKQVDIAVDQDSVAEFSDEAGEKILVHIDDKSELEMELQMDEGEDISFTYGWPPLVCCFGAAQHAFVPSGRRANRLIDHEMHERKKDAIWEPEKFVRAPGGCSSNVAVALANLGGKVALMGKLGDDDFGQSMLYYLNINKVQTRSIRLDSKRTTAVSQMKLSKSGGLRMANVNSCAEDSLSKSEINIDVLREAKMFYFNSFSLLDPEMRSTTLQAIKISKRFGGVIFYDLNLPLPLWQSSEETKTLIQQAWDFADIIEVSKQEIEFLCGIEAFEEFDTRNNDRSKFTHYAPELISPLWQGNLKVLFVTNGTSKIHYYTKEYNGAVLGMEDAPLTPYTSDMSASGDGVVAGIMRMLTVQPHLMTDKKYLEHTIKYAISCGVIDQWLQARSLGFPPKEGMEDIVPDINGLKSITEKEYRTIVPTTN